MVYGVFHRGVQCLLELLLADIVLILSNADCLWVNLYKFCKRILYTARDRDCTADRNIVVRQLLLCELRGRVDGGSCLICDKIMHVFEIVIPNKRSNELLRFIGCRTIANGDECHVVCTDEF